jgi:hypothetical protein
MTKHLRTVVEVAAVGTVALSVPVLGMLVSIPALNFLGDWGIDPGFVTPVGVVVGTLLPFVAGFCYGYKRELDMHFIAVWLGWVIGWQGYAFIMWASLLRHAHQPHRGSATPWVWVNWVLSIGWILLFALLPTLTTMWGQRRRVRAQRLST